MRRMKKAGQYLLGIFAALLLCGIFSVNTVKAESQHIYDNASLLSDAEEQDLERSCAEFENNTEIHMVILTERSSGSEDCQAIADDFYDKKYPKEPNGVCFLIDMGQRQIVISTSGIMQYYMSDTEIDDILQAAQGYAKDGDYAGTFAKMITMTPGVLTSIRYQPGSKSLVPSVGPSRHRLSVRHRILVSKVTRKFLSSVPKQAIRS